ncbi:protein spitz, putative, partial [Ixodes scapularis]
LRGTLSFILLPCVLGIVSCIVFGAKIECSLIPGVCSLVSDMDFSCLADGCSSRSTPKPRAPQSTVRPNITFQTYTCPEAYAKWYCLNGATCFAIKIGESILYNCECADGYMGQRCEFKDLDGTYLPTRQRVLIEKAGLAGGVTLAVLLVFLIVVFVYLYYRWVPR